MSRQQPLPSPGLGDQAPVGRSAVAGGTLLLIGLLLLAIAATGALERRPPSSTTRADLLSPVVPAAPPVDANATDDDPAASTADATNLLAVPQTMAPGTHSTPATPDSPLAPAVPTGPPTRYDWAVSGAASLVVRPAVEPLVIREQPSADATVTDRIPLKDDWGFPAVFWAPRQLVTDDGSLWYEVFVPERPNMRSGWVRAEDVTLSVTTLHLVLRLAGHRLELYDQGQLIRSYPIAVGKPGTPTPTGDFFIANEMATGSPGGAYGPYALGVSAFSDVLTDWPEGGQIGIHGTNARWSVGKSVSNGCVRLHNEDVTELSALIDPGTPVFIRE